MEKGTAIITGAGKRVGRVIAQALVADGWSVVTHVHDVADHPPARATKVVADLADPGCAETIFAATSGLPPVRLLINNAARFAWDGFGEFDPAQFDAHELDGAGNLGRVALAAQLADRRTEAAHLGDLANVFQALQVLASVDPQPVLERL